MDKIGRPIAGVLVDMGKLLSWDAKIFTQLVHQRFVEETPAQLLGEFFGDEMSPTTGVTRNSNVRVPVGFDL